MAWSQTHDTPQHNYGADGPFSFCSYPFLLNPRAKSKLLHVEARFLMTQACLPSMCLPASCNMPDMRLLSACVMQPRALIWQVQGACPAGMSGFLSMFPDSYAPLQRLQSACSMTAQMSEQACMHHYQAGYPAQAACAADGRASSCRVGARAWPRCVHGGSRAARPQAAPVQWWRADESACASRCAAPTCCFITCTHAHYLTAVNKNYRNTCMWRSTCICKASMRALLLA